MMKKIFDLKTEKDTEKIASEISSKVKDGGVICLYGEMGAGKTTFVKYLGKELGVKSRIISPTYVFIRKHKFNKSRNIYHIDAYRFSKEDDKEEIREILEEKDAIIIIEWAERIKSILPKKRIDIEFLVKSNNEREIRII